MKQTRNAALVGAALFALTVGALAQGPFAGSANMTCAQALKKAPKDDPSLAGLAKAFDSESAKLKKSPKDAKVPKEYVLSGVKYEQKVVRLPNSLNSPEKYRAGLALCRLVLAVDPKNPECKRDYDEIVTIYKSMNRPIPQ